MTPSRTDSVDQLPGHGSLLRLVPAAIAPRDAERDRIVIVGGGVGAAPRAPPRARTLGDRADVLVVSKDNHLVFTPMLPEVAAPTISPVNVVVPGRQLSRRTRWVAADVTGVDPRAKGLRYVLPDGREESTRFAHLVLACGMGVNLDTVPGLAAHALPLKSVGDGELGRLRRQHLAQGDIVYGPGDPARFLYLIEHGTATVRRAGIERGGGRDLGGMTACARSCRTRPRRSPCGSTRYTR